MDMLANYTEMSKSMEGIVDKEDDSQLNFDNVNLDSSIIESSTNSSFQADFAEFNALDNKVN